MFKPFIIKIINYYALKVFIIKFCTILFFATSLAAIIEVAATVGNFKPFDFFLNLGNIFSFTFFISSLWTIISLQRTREFIIFQVSTLSTIKIIKIFFSFIFCFSLFFLFVYNGVFLRHLSAKKDQTSIFLPQIEIYNKFEGECNYELLFLKNITFKSPEKTFLFSSGDLIIFKDCKFLEHKLLVADLIKSENNELFFSAQNLKIKYNFETFAKYFEEQFDSKAFKTFYQKLKLIQEFKAQNISSHALQTSVVESLQTVLSFFYMTLVSFLFFAKIPPRGAIIARLLASICLVATIYIVNMILIAAIKQVNIFNPILILIPSLTFIFIILFIIIFRRA